MAVKVVVVVMMMKLRKLPVIAPKERMPRGPVGGVVQVAPVVGLHVLVVPVVGFPAVVARGLW